MTRWQLVTLLLAVAVMTAAGNYISAVQQKREVAERTCRVFTVVLTAFQDQEKEAGASASRLHVYAKVLRLAEECR